MSFSGTTIIKIVTDETSHELLPGNFAILILIYVCLTSLKTGQVLCQTALKLRIYEVIKTARGSKRYDKSSHDNNAEANFTAVKNIIQEFSLNAVWYKSYLILDLSPDEE